MLPDVAASSESALRSLGFKVRTRNGDQWELILPNSRPATRLLRGDRGRITLSEARKRGDRSAGARTLLVASGASAGVFDAARLGRWDLLTWAPPRAVVNGVTYEAVGTGVPDDAPRRRDRLAVSGAADMPDGVAPAPARPSPSTAGTRADERTSLGTRHGGRLPWVRWGVARVLLLAGPQPVGTLAERLGVSPQAVRRALNQLGELVARRTDGQWIPTQPTRLHAAWAQAYPGPLGEHSTWWHPLPPEGQARAVALVAGRAGAQPLLAAREGHPAVTAYAREAVDLRPVGFVPAPPQRATLELVLPRDPTLWATAEPGTVAGEPALVVDRLITELG